jgi:hypothetical protein
MHMKLSHWVALTVLMGTVLGVAAPSLAQQQQERPRAERPAAPARNNGAPPRAANVDTRFNHNRAYPARGFAVDHVPEGSVTATFRGGSYYYQGGVWYQPMGGRFFVVAPPIGIVVPILPPFYTTVWFGGAPYYYANDTYYVWSADQQGYVVSDAPQDPDSATTQPPGAEDLFIYPKNGQSDQQQATDRYECHAWAREQTGFDPTQPLGGVDQGQVDASRAQYQRAEGACLEGRGYTVR